MQRNLKDYFWVQMRRLLEPTSKSRGPTLEQSVEEARGEWEAARRYFDSVSEPELVDQATYLIKATERRYMFLVRLFRTEERLRAERAASMDLLPKPEKEPHAKTRQA